MKKSAWDKFNQWDGAGCVWLIVALFAFSLFSKSCSGGSELPLFAQEDGSGNPAIELAGDGPDYDPNTSHIETAAAESRLWEAQDYSESLSSKSSSSSSCPSGCSSPPSGCVIKGNISFNSSEKIYHMPGDPYYSETSIAPAYGERWFCTEAEALANGWRRASH
jgi:hypothetical protein